MRLIISLLFMVSFLIGNATEKVGGVVKERQSGEVISNAAVTLLSLPDSIYAGATVTDIEGRFSLAQPADANRYVVKVTAPGCNPLVVERLSPAMEIILDARESDLQEVVVRGKRQELKMILQGFSFDPKYVISHSNNALDVLRFAPLIEMKDSKKPQLIGKGKTEIHINGRKSQKSEEQILAELEAMPASNVKSVEMLVNTGSRYESSSDTGIINIEIREPHEGLLGRASMSGEIADKESGIFPSLNIDYSRRKFNVGGWFSLLQYKMQTNNDYRYDDLMTGMNEESIFHNRSHFTEARIGFNAGYAISENQRLEVSARVGAEYKHSTLFDQSLVSIGGEQRMFTHNSVERKPFTPHNYMAGLGYYLKTSSKGSNLQINLDYVYTEDPTDVLNRYNDISLPQRNSKFETWIFGNIDGKQIFNQHHSIQYGYHFGVTKNNNLSLYLVDPIVVNPYMHSSHYLPTEYRHSLYADYYWQLNDKLNFSIGLRAEYKDINGELKLPEEESFQMKKWEWLPQFTATWNVRPLHILSFNFRRNVSWPYASWMSPEKQWESENRYSTGNPNMMPVAYYNTSLSYYFLNAFTLKLSYERRGDQYLKYIGPGEEANTIATTYRLLTGKGNMLSTNFTYKKNFFNYRWMMLCGASYIYTKFDYLREDGTPYRKNHSYIELTFNNDIVILSKQKLYGNVYMTARSPHNSITYQNNEWNYYLYLGVSKYFSFGELQIMTPWIDLLQMKYKGDIVTDTYRVTYKNNIMPWGINIMFSYNFGNRSVTKNRIRTAAL